MAASDPESEGRRNFTEEELEQEKAHIQRVINAFLSYRAHALQRVSRALDNYHQLPSYQQKMLTQYAEHLAAVRAAVETNHQFVQSIVDKAVGMFDNDPQFTIPNPQLISFQHQIASGFDMEKVKTTIKQFYRDWSVEGQAERDSCYKPIIDEIKKRFPSTKCIPSEVSVLVPGAGLGRLAWEIAHLGYQCQGNEFSMYMLFGSHFILNEVTQSSCITIHPWLLHFCNSMSYHNQLCPVQIPDVIPTNLPTYGLFSMAAGDFLEVYIEKDKWDCVATCYFMDTAHNIISYLENIHNILKPGGYWVNFGPLLYHFADMPNELSIELCYEDIHRIAEEKIGFQFLEEQTGVKSSYISDPHSMMQMTYNCVFSVAQKQQPASQ